MGMDNEMNSMPMDEFQAYVQGLEDPSKALKYSWKKLDLPEGHPTVGVMSMSEADRVKRAMKKSGIDYDKASAVRTEIRARQGLPPHVLPSEENSWKGLAIRTVRKIPGKFGFNVRKAIGVGEKDKFELTDEEWEKLKDYPPPAWDEDDTDPARIFRAHDNLYDYTMLVLYPEFGMKPYPPRNCEHAKKKCKRLPTACSHSILKRCNLKLEDYSDVPEKY